MGFKLFNSCRTTLVYVRHKCRENYLKMFSATLFLLLMVDNSYQVYQKTRKVKAENEVIYSFMPENANLRNARDVTLNVLDMLSNDVESSRSGILSRDSDDQLFPNSFGNNEDNLVDSYLEQTSLVDCAAASIPLKEKKIVQ